MLIKIVLVIFFLQKNESTMGWKPPQTTYYIFHKNVQVITIKKNVSTIEYTKFWCKEPLQLDIKII